MLGGRNHHQREGWILEPSVVSTHRCPGYACEERPPTHQCKFQIVGVTSHAPRIYFS
jgi:hypothetical protein